MSEGAGEPRAVGALGPAAVPDNCTTARRWGQLARRVSDWSVNKAMKAAENDIVLSERFLRVA